MNNKKKAKAKKHQKKKVTLRVFLRKLSSAWRAYRRELAVRFRDVRLRERKSLKEQKVGLVIICMVLVVLSGALGVGSVKLYAKNEDYKKQEAELNKQIEEQERRAAEVKAFEEYVKTDEYIKNVAEEKLGLTDPNEIIFKPVE